MVAKNKQPVNSDNFTERLRKAEEMIRSSRQKEREHIEEKRSQQPLSPDIMQIDDIPTIESEVGDPALQPPPPRQDSPPAPVPEEKLDWTSEAPIPVRMPLPTPAPVVLTTPTIEEWEPAPTPQEQQLETVPKRNQLIEENLTQTVETDSSIKTVAKELFNRNNIDLKTEVTHDEINNITKLRFLQVKYGVENVDVLVHSLLGLRVSKNRKSRQEFVNIVQTENRNAQGGFMSKLAGAFGGGNNNAT